MTQQQQQRSRSFSSGAALPSKPFHVPRMSGPPPAAASTSTLTTVPSSATKASDRLRKLLLDLQQAKLASHLPKQVESDAVYAQWREILRKLETVDVATLVSFTKAQSLEMLRVVQMSKQGLDAIYSVLSKKAVSADNDLEDWQIVLDWLEGVVEIALKPKPKTSPVNPYASPSRQSLTALAASGGVDVAQRQAGPASQSQDLPRARSEGAPSPARNTQGRLQKLSPPRSSALNGVLSGAATNLPEEEDLRENDGEIGGPPQSHLGDLLLPPPGGRQAPRADVPSDAIASDGGVSDQGTAARVDKGKGRYVSPRDLQQAPPPDDSDDDEQLSPPRNTLKPFGNGFNAGAVSLTAIGGVDNGSEVDMEDDDEANAFLRFANDAMPTSAQQAGPSHAVAAPSAQLGFPRPGRKSEQGLFAPDPQANDGGLADAEVDMLASNDDQLEYANPAPQKKKGKQPIRRTRPAKKKAVEVNPDGEEDQLASQEGTGAGAAAGVDDASAGESNGAGRPCRQSKTDAANKLGALDWSRRVPKKATQVPASTAQGGRGSSTQPAPSKKKKGKKVERAYTSSEDELEEDKPKKRTGQKGKRRAPASPARSDSEEPAQTQRKSKRSRPAVEPAGSKRKSAKAGSSSSNSSKAKPTRALKQKDANVKASQAKPRASSVAASQAKKPKVEPRERREGTRRSSRASIQTGPTAAAAASQAMTPEAGFKPGEIGYVVNQTMSSKCWPALILRVKADRVRIAVLPGKAADASAVPKFRDVTSTLQSGPPITLERDDPPLLESSRSVALTFAMNFLEDRPRFRAWKNAAINADGSAEGATDSSDGEDDDGRERAGMKLSEGVEEDGVAVDDDDESE